MACTWLDEHPADVVEALWGQASPASPLWDHMGRCSECAQAFDDMNRCVALLQRLPPSNPPRLVYLPAAGRPGRLGSIPVRIALVVVLALLTGALIGQWLEHRQYQRQLPTVVQAALQQHALRYQATCTAAAREAIRDAEARLLQEYRGLVRLIDDRFANYDALLIQLQGDIETLHRRQRYLWEDTQNKFQSILQTTYRNQ